MAWAAEVPEAPEKRGLDLPGVLPLLLVAATWEFLLNRVVGLAAGAASQGELEGLLSLLGKLGFFAQNLALLLALGLLGEATLSLTRQPTFGPLPHRVTVTGFAGTLILISGAGALTALRPETALLAHSAAVLMVALLMMGLFWQPVSRWLVVAALLLFVPTVLRFYASCAISLPVLRTASALPLWAFRAAEYVALGVIIASPVVVMRHNLGKFVRHPPVVTLTLASLPAAAFAAVLSAHHDDIRELCLLGLGLELIAHPAGLFYPLALFCLFLTLAFLILPGSHTPRTDAEQRLGYGLALIFLAGLDGLRGTVLALGAEGADVPELVRFLLEGHWEHLNPLHQALVGPPIRDLYQLMLLGLGYVLVVRGIQGEPRSVSPPVSSAAQEEIAP